ncbi:MAG: metal-sensing transcriptional repressor [Oscillospiraceae bacterium]|jgi:DNA-binding FrmR family transcriptional regulator|nr:metal-sensing transcriptional repressor [Oscillospiraceae bacterium]
MNESSCCRKKAVPRDEAVRKALIHRLNRIEGQIRGVRGMVENEIYCNDILIQCAAVSAALNAFQRELLADHIRSCVADELRAGKDEVVDELLETIQKMMR